MRTTKTTKHVKINTMRMKDIISQLTDIIYLLCNAKENNITTVLNQFTNITQDELDSLNIFFPHDNS